MAVLNPISITYGSRTVGGSSGLYQLNGPYVFDHSYRTLRLVFDVIVVSSTTDGLASAAKDLEDDFRLRDRNLSINMGITTWTFTAGSTYFNPRASISKTGDRETDRGVSRAYTCVIEAELPSDDVGTGLDEVEYSVDYEPGRRQVVSVQGTYTATNGATAFANYQSNADTLINSFLASLPGSESYELVDESHRQDRNNANLEFSRQYQQVLSDQSDSAKDDSDIVDHRMIFSELASHPGDSREDIFRLRRVVGAYDCAIDVEQTTDLESVFKNKVRDHVVDLFKSNFNPSVFAVEDFRVSYDESAKRLSVSLQFLYQKDGGDNVVEVSQSLTIREQRTLDYTPVHNASELAFHVDPGWATVERVWSRTAVVIGDELPQRRIGVDPRYDEIGDFDAMGEHKVQSGKSVRDNGWNVVANTSQVTDQYIGDPSSEFEQIKAAVITETVVERFHEKPTN